MPDCQLCLDAIPIGPALCGPCGQWLCYWDGLREPTRHAELRAMDAHTAQWDPAIPDDPLCAG